MDLAAMILKRCLVFRQSNRRTREFTGLTSDKFVFYSINAFPNKSFLWFKYRDKPIYSSGVGYNYYLSNASTKIGHFLSGCSMNYRQKFFQFLSYVETLQTDNDQQKPLSIMSFFLLIRIWEDKKLTKTYVAAV